MFQNTVFFIILKNKRKTQNSKKENLKDVLFIKQKPYKTKTSLLWAKQREHFYKQRKETHYKTSLLPWARQENKNRKQEITSKCEQQLEPQRLSSSDEPQYAL